MAAKKETYITEAEMAQSEKTTGEILAAQPKVSVMITPDKKNPMFHCTINGYSYKFPRGEVVEVPKDVAELISNLHQSMVTLKEQEDRLVKGFTI